MKQKSSDEYELPWVEKYRPHSLSEVASQSITIQTLQKFVNKRQLPHLIFTGPAGTGKTSTAYALINDLLGTEKINQDMILERNASDNVRMDTRDEIKNFVNHSSMFQDEFKFVILDEADLIPKAMQGAFRRIIEMAPANVKFIFMCNYIENIIDPVLSRCAIFRFYPLPQREFENQIKKICKLEKIQINQMIMDSIFFISQGDMRRAINLLQMAIALSYNENAKRNSYDLSSDTIYKISGFLPVKIIDDIINALEKGNFQRVKLILSENSGFSSRGLFRQILQRILDIQYVFPLNEKMIAKIGEYDYRLTLEADINIQIDGFFADIISLLEDQHD